MSNIASLIPNKPDKELAEEYKQKIIEAYKPILEVLNQAKKDNFIVNVSCGDTPTGVQIVNLQVLKSF